jgi:hypothetical protein
MFAAMACAGLIALLAAQMRALTPLPVPVRVRRK